MIKPLGDRVVVKILEEEKKTVAGLVIPDTAKEKPQTAKVLAIGKGKLNDNGEYQPIEVQVGDKVIYSKYSGTEITIDNEDCLILSESDILAIA
jgi:chaperonin GroES